MPRKASGEKSELVKKLAGKIKPKPAWIRRPELLLCPNVPKPMHGVAPREILGAKWWDATRKAAYKATDYHCMACGVWKHEARFRQWMEGHEFYDVDYSRGRMVYVETVALCHCCHNSIHDGRMRALVEQGKMTHAKYAAIVQHGDAVLRAAGLARPTYDERELALTRVKIAPWGSWRLVLFGKLYPPKFKTFDEWKKAFGVS